MNDRTAEWINTLGEFCGARDIDALSRDALLSQCGIEQADVMVLFGGSILAGGDLFAKAMLDKIARVCIIVGGAGHTTETLRQRVHGEYPDIETQELPEAEVFQRYLRHVYHCEADYLETASTNCGNNITNLLALLSEKSINAGSIILIQDASMQKRMDAGMRKYASPNTRIINYAAYSAKVTASAQGLCYAQPIHGMWPIERYVNLLMGEIPRLTDDPNGYGPNGKGYIAHVDVPERVSEAFEALKAIYGDAIRGANPLYATKT